MTTQDRYTVGDFAKRYKLKGAELKLFCKRSGVSAETVLSRDEFRRLLDEIKNKPTLEADGKETNTPSRPKREEDVKEATKTLDRWVSEKISHAGVGKKAYLKVVMDWEDETRITESAFDKAVRKHLLNKE
ncbi:hypothetical protein GF359_05015 [candidate division WOR-3 bacterium]|uniref:Uncharacterized protein n=1 Tax=candidate division WOR-3 bacterium TaxID=2052148 RepID=A0A9D5QD09_UNCW3|nr:hypothetical protein [candidate division WOR-3 bacterium]MBD3364556.1 hypothetical protein [candidate division WOR-3 bacterium]